MKTDMHSDHGSVLGPREAALVVAEDGTMSLRYPHYGDDDDVPKAVQLLAAILIAAEDEQWCDDLLKVFKDS